MRPIRERNADNAMTELAAFRPLFYCSRRILLKQARWIAEKLSQHPGLPLHVVTHDSCRNSDCHCIRIMADIQPLFIDLDICYYPFQTIESRTGPDICMIPQSTFFVRLCSSRQVVSLSNIDTLVPWLLLRMLVPLSRVPVRCAKAKH